nr:immunoglobulin light chain junction region [Macaca mulatta]MOV79015.1 immunoglobulin light chain junction region [Macaca mulatta]MOV81256.1 immunoglobulin light chain junction region [Macaca mulatta]MOV81654.1 immunoglobulin light chain junction region [Macaca mulatta]MOV82806.1 immunoglobulin light chain junction region [Macaca mulatta]
CQKYSSFPFTF